MTQGLALGITVGSSNTVAVTIPERDDDLHAAAIDVRPSAPVSEDVLARVGDPVAIRTDDGDSIAAADLVAELVGCLSDDTGPVATVLGYPAWWSGHAVTALRAALDHARLTDLTLIPEPVAAVRGLAATHDDVSGGAPVVVYDLGASGITVSVVGAEPGAGLLAQPLRSTETGGAEFDLLTMRYVLANAQGENSFDPFDPMVERELAALRRRCEKAKEELSAITATVVPVRLPGSARDVRLVRDELEDLLRESLLASLDLIHRAARLAGLDRIERVLLTGGGSGIPLLTELVSTEFGVTPITVENPAHTAARGAALLAADIAAQAVDTAPAPEVAATTEALAVQRLPEPERAALLPPLPQARPTPRFGSWRRAAFVAGAAVAVAALATGTLAVGTALQSTPTSNSSSTSTGTSATGTPTTANSATASAGSVAPVANTAPGQSDRAPGAAAPVASRNSTDPAAPAAAGNPSTPGTPGTASGAPQAAAPDANTPAPQANSPAPQPAPAPAPAPSAPTVQPPVVQPPTAPSPPTRPSVPDLGSTLNNGLDQTGNTLGQVLDTPGQVLGHTGG
ncbi:Hsp70 family protein [Nocardia sp. NPDC003482]